MIEVKMLKETMLHLGKLLVIGCCVLALCNVGLLLSSVNANADMTRDSSSFNSKQSKSYTCDTNKRALFEYRGGKPITKRADSTIFYCGEEYAKNIRLKERICGGYGERKALDIEWDVDTHKFFSTTYVKFKVVLEDLTNS